MGYVPVVFMKTNRKEKWEYDEKYIKEYMQQKFFLRIKKFRRIVARYDKLDVMFCGFIYFAFLLF